MRLPILIYIKINLSNVLYLINIDINNHNRRQEYLSLIYTIDRILLMIVYISEKVFLLLLLLSFTFHINEIGKIEPINLCLIEIDSSFHLHIFPLSTMKNVFI